MGNIRPTWERQESKRLRELLKQMEIAKVSYPKKWSQRRAFFREMERRIAAGWFEKSPIDVGSLNTMYVARFPCDTLARVEVSVNGLIRSVLPMDVFWRDGLCELPWPE